MLRKLQSIQNVKLDSDYTDYISFMNQEHSNKKGDKGDYTFSVQFQYLGDSFAKQIFATIAGNFLLTAWMKDFKSSLAVEGGKQLQKLGIALDDYRYFKPKTDHLQLLFHEQLELKGLDDLAQITKQCENSSGDSALSPQEMQKINEEIRLNKQTVKVWQYSQALINYMIKERLLDEGLKQDLMSKQSFSIGLFQIKGRKYLLLRSNIRYDTKQLKGNQQDLIISLKYFSQYQTTKQINIPTKDIKDILFYFEYEFAGQKQKQITLLNQLKYLESNQNNNIKLIDIDITLKDKNSFFNKQLKIEQGQYKSIFKSFYQAILDVKDRNKIIYPYREYQSKYSKKFYFMNYSLAFQGGGAKGLAYVGAYRALRENKIDGKRIPAKTIMGTSAGGITALGASTDIPDYQLQRICYKMNDIPKNDRFYPGDPDNQFVPKDQYGIQLNFEKVTQNIRTLLKQYGIIDESTFDLIMQEFKSDKFQVIEEKLVRYLQAANPPAGQMLALNYSGSEKTEDKRSAFQKFFNLNKDKQTSSSRLKLNWQGLLLHGALMKGQAIHDIAADLLVKYLLKNSFQIKNDNLYAKLDDAFRLPNPSIGADGQIQLKNRAERIMKCLQNNKTYSLDLLNVKLNDIKTNLQQQLFNEIITALLNKYIILIDNIRKSLYSFKNVGQDYHSLNLESIKLSPIIKIKDKSITKFKEVGYNKDTLKTLADLFKASYLLKKLQLEDSKHPNNPKRAVIIQQLQKQRNDLINVTTYRELNSLFDCFNLIDYTLVECDWSITEDTTVLELMKTFFSRQIFEKQLQTQDYIKNQKIEIVSSNIEALTQKYFCSLEAAEIVSDTLIYIFNNTHKAESKQELIKDKFKGTLVVALQYAENLVQLKSLIKRITLKQYYAMTNIELTCCSVDLDNKVLRLLNHKTAPELPVCKSVQMTGSFPIGFKAPRWRKQWGSYYIHLNDRKIRVDINGSQFTDGGLLANFPIRYLDNEEIQPKYFAHKQVKGFSILLGFGLNYLDPKQYELTERQANEQRLQEDEIKTCFRDMMSQFSLFMILDKPIRSILWNIVRLKGNLEEVEWTKIYHQILQKIPLLRFGLKIADAYPMADRNLNIEAFGQRILTEQIKPYWQPINLYYSALTAQENGEIIRAIHFFKDHRPFKIKPLQNSSTISANAKSESFKKDCSALFEQRIQDKNDKNLIILAQIQEQIKNNPFTLYQSQQKSSSLKESTVCENIINILMVNLKRSDNKAFVQSLNKEYAFLKFILSYTKESSQNGIFNEADQTRQLNKINFESLYNVKDYQQIQNHLNFLDFDAKHYENYIKLENKKQKAEQGLISRFISLFHKNPDRNRYIREEIYRERSKTKDQFERQQLHNKLNQLPNNANFADMEIYDITDTLRRLTQFIYLSIKCRNSDRTFKSLKELIPIIKRVKSVNYQCLLRPEEHYPNFKWTYITYDEIVNYIRSLIQQVNPLKIEPTFEKIVRNRRGQFGTIIDYLYQLYSFSENKKDEQAKSIWKDEYKDIYNSTLKQRLIQYGLKKMAAQKELVLQKFRDNQIAFNEGDYHSFLEYIVDKDNNNLHELTDSPAAIISNERVQYILREKENSLKALFRLVYGTRGVDLLEIKDLQKQFIKQIAQNRSQLIAKLNNIKQIEVVPAQFLSQKLGSQRKFSLLSIYLIKIAELKSIKRYIVDKLNDPLILANKHDKERLLCLTEAHFVDMEFIMNNIKETLFIISRLSDNKGQYKQQLNIIVNVYQNVFNDFVNNLKKVSEIPLKSLNEQSISSAFIIKFENIRITAQQIHIFFLKRYVQLLGTTSDEQKYIRYIYQNTRKINRSYLSLPLFSDDWDLCVKATDQKYINKINSILRNDSASGTHLVMEGVGKSNQNYGGIYAILSKIYQTQQKGKTFKKQLKSITCSNFHSVFGFLYLLGKSAEEIREDMYKLRFYVNQFSDEKNIQSYFESNAWMQQSPNKFSEVIKYLEAENQSFFTRLQQLSSQKYNQRSLSKQFQQMKRIYQNQKQRLIENYGQILDQTTSKIEFIDGAYSFNQKGLKISQAFAYDHTCDLKHSHNYSQVSRTSINMFGYLLEHIYDNFGSLIEAAISNTLVTNSPLNVDNNNASLFVKGMITMRLLNTYKLKDFIQQQLTKVSLSPIISIQEFTKLRNKDFLLNFSTININQKRIDFLNIQTVPKMPIWAAIIASSTLPFFHSFFQANKQWESVAVDQFHNFVVNDFFGTNYTNKKQRVNQFVSANSVAPLPIQLLTNRVIQTKLFPSVSKMKYMGFAFNQSLYNNVPQFLVSKKYLNFSFSKRLPLIKYGLSFGWLYAASKVRSLFNKNNNDYNNNYEIKYPQMKYLTSSLDQGSFATIRSSLSESNDNFIFKWYYDKLVRLPIKINTLSFNEIVDLPILKQFRVLLPTEKAAETILRSYEITKSFTQPVVSKQSEHNRYLAKIRVQIFTKHHEITGFEKEYVKLSLLNHSKWNQNKYNNFVVEYSVDDGSGKFNFARASNSEIIWQIEKGSSVVLKFFFPVQQIEYSKVQKSNCFHDEPKYLINYTKMVLDCHEVIQRLPFKDSFDYEFVFAGDELKSGNLIKGQNAQQLIKEFKPIKRNSFYLGETKQNEVNRGGLLGVPALKQRLQCSNIMIPQESTENIFIEQRIYRQLS